MPMEKPPILTGSMTQQVAALRDYLFRMASSLDNVAENKNSFSRNTVQKSYSKSEEKTAAEIQQQALKLKALILKTADEVMEYADKKVEEYNSMYVAKSEFGTYAETVNSTIQTTAKDTVESYHYDSAIESNADSIAELQSYVNTLNGEIRRGIITDPSTNEEHLGIAISENATFTGTIETRDGNQYYRISPGQTFGLYTSYGWQFWVNGARVGWLDSTDGMLHVANVLIEDTLQMGASWEVSTDGGFGIRYIGT